MLNNPLRGLEKNDKTDSAGVSSARWLDTVAINSDRRSIFVGSKECGGKSSSCLAALDGVWAKRRPFHLIDECRPASIRSGRIVDARRHSVVLLACSSQGLEGCRTMLRVALRIECTVSVSRKLPLMMTRCVQRMQGTCTTCVKVYVGLALGPRPKVPYIMSIRLEWARHFSLATTLSHSAGVEMRRSRDQRNAVMEAKPGITFRDFQRSYGMGISTDENILTRP